MRSRLVRALPAGLLAVALLSGCGDETEPDASTSDRAADTAPTLTSRLLGGDPLDVTEAIDALIADANVPGFMTEGEPTEAEPPAESDGLSGCETSDSFEDRFDYARTAVTRVGQEYVFADDARLLFIDTTVASFQNEAQAEAALDEFAAEFGECDDFEDTSGGTSVVVDVEHDEEPATADVDDQFNLTAAGDYTEAGAEPFGMGMGFSLARVGNTVTITAVLCLGVPEDRDLVQPYTEIAVDRLVAVINGETPEDVAGPAPSEVPASRLPIDPAQVPLDRFNKVAPRYGMPG